MSSLAPSVSHRDPKGRKFMSITEAAYDKAGLSEDEAQRVNEAPGLSDVIAEFIAKHRVRQDFASEEVPSNYGYLSGYTKPRPLEEQAAVLREAFPEYANATYDASIAEQPLPEGAEGWFIVPADWKKLANTYASGACKKVFGKVREVYGGNAVNYLEREGKLTERHLRESAAKRAAMEQIREAQKGHDFLVVAGQFGHLHRGRSVRRARVVMQDSGQFGFGLFESLILLLTHPDRLRHYDDLWIDCAGDEISLNGDGQFSVAPYVYFSDGMLKVYAYRVGNPHDNYGSVSGFSPQS
jgi:hypothetical protein